MKKTMLANTYNESDPVTKKIINDKIAQVAHTTWSASPRLWKFMLAGPRAIVVDAAGVKSTSAFVAKIPEFAHTRIDIVNDGRDPTFPPEQLVADCITQGVHEAHIRHISAEKHITTYKPQSLALAILDLCCGLKEAYEVMFELFYGRKLVDRAVLSFTLSRRPGGDLVNRFGKRGNIKGTSR
jgi:hypothetical protein